MPTVASLTITPAYMMSLLDCSGASWDLVIPSGIVYADKCILINSHASGGATFYALSTCIDGGGNTGWIFLAAPELTTKTPSVVTTNEITALAELVSKAEETTSVSRRGFCFVEGVATPTTDDEVVYEDGDFDVGNYSLSIAGLLQNTRYSVRAYIVSAGVTFYGNTVAVYTYPAVPENLEAEAGEDYITLTWDEVDGANSYNLYWSETPGVTSDSECFVGITTPFVHAGLSPMLSYYYRVSAVSGTRESGLSIEVSSQTLAAEDFPTFSPQNWKETEDYIKLLTSQYQMAEKFKEWLRKNIDICKDIMEAANNMNNVFDLDFAVGAQLDIIGQIVGQKRVLPFQPSDGTDPNLDDDMYRTLLKAKIALNHWDGKLLSIEQKWTSIFPGTSIVIVDNQDMTINVSVLGEISELVQELIENDMIIPRPQAVQINYAWSPRRAIIFAYDMDNDEYSGYDKGQWSTDYTEG